MKNNIKINKMKRIILFSLAAFSVMACNKISIKECCNGVAQITSVDSSLIAIPDVFTPNGDGINDVLFVYQKNISSFSFTIEKNSKINLFSTTDAVLGWDGTYEGEFVKEQDYVYSIEATTLSGKTLNLSGSVCMIRDKCTRTTFENCFFGNQFNGTYFDQNLPSQENIKACD